MACKIILVPSLFMHVRQATASLFVFLTSSGCTVLAPHVHCQLVKVDVTNQGALEDRWYTESHTEIYIKDVYHSIIYNSKQ